MSTTGATRLAFNVDTSRVLQILTSEIYDSPKAFLRENVQNAYDAILMRCEYEGLRIEDRCIEITVESSRITVHDDGIGMDRNVLAENFWKAGSSGKKTGLAQRSGVIGTFGIGAMANFGVCSSLRVETRHVESAATLVTTARRDDLAIAEECIDLLEVVDEREPGTLIVAELDDRNHMSESMACDYLKQYVRFLPVPVLVNGQLISQESYADFAITNGAGFQQIYHQEIFNSTYRGVLDVEINQQSRVMSRLTDIKLNGNGLSGEVCLVQDGGPTYAYRNYFGLAPVPVSGHYSFGGYVNLDILHPTAGREALSRESIQHVAGLVQFIEAGCSLALAEHPAADNNQQFQRHILSNRLIEKAKKVRIMVRPVEAMIALEDVQDFEPDKTQHFYTGTDNTILTRFATDQSNLFHVSPNNPRRDLQTQYLRQFTQLENVPDRTTVDRIPATGLTIEEAMFLAKLRGILLDDYLMAEVDVYLADISHGVEFYTHANERLLEIAIGRNVSVVRTVIECYKTAKDVFVGFMKDFVREHLYPQIRAYVPSSTQQGRDALYQRLKANKELFRLQQSDYGEMEDVLAEYISGNVDLAKVLTTATTRMASQLQRVSGEQVGSVESEMPDIIGSVVAAVPTDESQARPPIIRPETVSEMKVLTVSTADPMLNNVRMFLALSDRVFNAEGEFLRWPHTTKLIWGSHRIVYIFGNETDDVSLYYDIELKDPLDFETTGGSMVPTTTLITGNRIYVPVPADLEPAFKVTEETKDYYVRFDTLP
jgi:molecular chaperone HtpG